MLKQSKLATQRPVSAGFDLARHMTRPGHCRASPSSEDYLSPSSRLERFREGQRASARDLSRPQSVRGHHRRRVYTLVGRGAVFEEAASDRAAAGDPGPAARAQLFAERQPRDLHLSGREGAATAYRRQLLPVSSAPAVDQHQHHRRYRRFHPRERRHGDVPWQPQVAGRAGQGAHGGAGPRRDHARHAGGQLSDHAGWGDLRVSGHAGARRQRQRSASTRPGSPAPTTIAEAVGAAAGELLSPAMPKETVRAMSREGCRSCSGYELLTTGGSMLGQVGGYTPAKTLVPAFVLPVER